MPTSNKRALNPINTVIPPRLLTHCAKQTGDNYGGGTRKCPLGGTFSIQHRILSTSQQRNVWPSVRRISFQILRVAGLKAISKESLLRLSLISRYPSRNTNSANKQTNMCVYLCSSAVCVSKILMWYLLGKLNICEHWTRVTRFKPLRVSDLCRYCKVAFMFHMTFLLNNIIIISVISFHSCIIVRFLLAYFSIFKGQLTSTCRAKQIGSFEQCQNKRNSIAPLCPGQTRDKLLLTD